MISSSLINQIQHIYNHHLHHFLQLFIVDIKNRYNLYLFSVFFLCFIINFLQALVFFPFETKMNACGRLAIE